MKMLSGSVALVISLFISTAQAMRCGNQLVTEGDTVAQIYEKCGEPSASYGDVWGDKQERVYKDGNGGQETIKILNGRVTDVEFNRN
jgi:hypothetical protein